MKCQQNLEKHQSKLEEYIQNPDAKDNRGFLEKAGNDLERRNRIIQTRIKHLQGEIKTWLKQLETLKELLEKVD